MALKTVQSKINNVKSSIGNVITVSPAGVRGFEGGGELLTETDVNKIKSISHIVNTTENITDRLTKDENTSLTSAIDPGSFGQRQQSQQGNNNTQQGQNNSQTPRNFTMPVTATGTNDLNTTSNLNVTSLKITSGAKFDATSSQNVALIGTDLAAKNNLSIGSIFQVYGKDIKVIGIFDGGNKFANSSAIMPLKILQQLSSQANQVNSVIVQTDSIDTISSVQDAIKKKLGDKVDIVSQQDSAKQAVVPLENIKTISLYSLIGSLVAGAIIIFLIMMMIVRERRREIGVLKAIGSSNIKIVSQFTVESLVLTLMSSVLGIILGVIFSNPILKVLVSNSESSTATGGGPGQGMMARVGMGFMGAQNALRDINAVVSYDIILYGILVAVIIAIIGSAIPSFIIAKVRPAEVMRAE